jgi:hypothetical protein
MKLFEIIFAVAILSLLALAAVRAAVIYWKRTRNNVRLMANAANQPGTGRNTTGRRTFLCGLLADWTTFAAAYTNTFQPPGRFACVILSTDPSGAQAVRISSSATDNIVGICEDAPDATDDPLVVALLSTPGTLFAVAAGAITAGALLQSNGDGAVTTYATSGAYCIGRTINGAGAAGDIVEFIPTLSGATHA